MVAKKPETEPATEELPKVERKRSVATKLRLKEMGNAKDILARPENEKRLVLAVLMGVVYNVKETKAIDGLSVLSALRGAFEVVPKDVSRDILTSDTCFIPDELQGKIVDLLPGGSVQFACELASVRTNTESKCSYAMKFISDPVLFDPLAGLRAAVIPPDIEIE